MLFKKTEQNLNTNDLKWRLIGLTGKTLIDLIFCGSRIEAIGQERHEALMASRRFLLAFWHSRILLVSYYFKGFNASIMVSDSADGEIIARILQRQGQQTVRGSTGKGGMRALSRQVHYIRQHGLAGSVVPDGPQGPRHKVQPGIILLAQKTGYPIVPVTYSAKRRVVFNSWDRFILPYPATSCRIQFGNLIDVPPELNTDMLARCSKQLELELNRITTESDGYFGFEFEP